MLTTKTNTLTKCYVFKIGKIPGCERLNSSFRLCREYCDKIHRSRKPRCCHMKRRHTVIIQQNEVLNGFLMKSKLLHILDKPSGGKISDSYTL